MQEDKIKRNRLGHHNYKPNQFTEINQVGFTVDTKKKMVIPKNTAAQIIVKTKLRAETVFSRVKKILTSLILIIYYHIMEYSK